MEEGSDDSDDDSDDDTVMTGTLSTESAVQRVESTLLSSEREIYMGLSDEEKKEFLLRKKAENKRIVSCAVSYYIIINPYSSRRLKRAKKLSRI